MLSGRWTFALLFGGACVVGACRPAEPPTRLTLEVFNPHTVAWHDAPVTLRLESYDVQLLPYARVYRNQDGVRREIPSQLDDLDLDGMADQLFFLVDLDANETAHYVVLADSVAPVYPVRAAATTFDLADTLVSPTRTNPLVQAASSSSTTAPPAAGTRSGLLWESDRAAYRSRLEEPGLTEVLSAGTLDQLSDDSLASAGPDVLLAGTTLGLGTPAIAGNDSFIYFTSADDAHVEILANGPLRGLVRTRFEDVAVSGSRHDVVSEVEIHAGSRWTEHRIFVDETLSDRQLVTGLPRHESSPRLHSGSAHGAFYVYTLGPQSANGDQLGAVLMVPDRLRPRLQTVGPRDHHVRFVAENEVASYRYMATWEQGPYQALTEPDLLDAINLAAARWMRPVQVSVSY